MLLEFVSKMSASSKWVGCASLCFLFINACAVGRRHTSDSELEQKFYRHEAQFEALRIAVQAEAKLQMIGIRELRYGDGWLSGRIDLSEIERLGLAKERWAWYQQQMRELGLVQLFRASDGVTFKVDPASILNGDSCKGYTYSLTPPEHQKSSLDEYRLSESDRNANFRNYDVCRPLKGHWYLYLFING